MMHDVERHENGIVATAGCPQAPRDVLLEIDVGRWQLTKQYAFACRHVFLEQRWRHDH